VDLVGKLWFNPDEGQTFSGRITLPYALPAGVPIQAILVPRPLRSRKEMMELHIETLLELPPEPLRPIDIPPFKGELMNEFFGPARPPGRRAKVMIMGGSGTGKTLSALGFPRCAYIDNHRSSENYQTAYPDNLYLPKPGQVATVDYVTDAIKALMEDPGDRLTVVIDDITTYNDQVDFKWNNRFLLRQPGSKGHHREYYSNQPNDYIHPKREKNAFIRRLLAMDMNVIIIARMKKEYAGTSGGADFMKVIGETFAGDPNLVYEFDYIFHLLNEDEGRFAEIKLKQRVPVGGKPFPERFPFLITDEGRSDFFDIFKATALSEYFDTMAQKVKDPVLEAENCGEVKEDKPADTVQPSEIAPEKASTAAVDEIKQAEETPPPAGNPANVTEAQLDQIVALKQKYNIQKPEWEKDLKLYDVTSALDLTGEQAEHFIKYLESGRVPF
jgi:hypothetical protein